MPKWFDMEIASLDTETTDLDTQKARVIEIGIVCFKQGKLIDEYSQLVDPGEPIPKEVYNTTGISDKDVAGMPRFSDVKDRLLQCLENRLFLAYNAPYDLGVLKTEFHRLGLEFPTLKVIDPLVLSREVLKLKSYKLGLVAEHLGISMERAHRAKDDALAAMQILYRIADRLPQDLDELLQLQQQWQNAQESRRRQWSSRKRDVTTDVLNSTNDSKLRLGPAYVYSKETDPDPLVAFIRDYASKFGK